MDTKINILILEDEGIVALSLEDTLQLAGYHVCGVADNGESALQIAEKEAIDLVLLDIHLRGEWDGIETGRRIKAIKNVPIIYLTAFSDRETLQRAKETHPAAYLIKPYQPQSLLVAIDVALHNFAAGKTADLSDALPAREGQAPGEDEREPVLCFNDAIFIKENYKFNKVNFRDIYYLESENNYTRVFTKTRNFLVRHSLNKVMSAIHDTAFIRVHRSYIINADHLDKFDNHSVFLSAHEIPLGRNYKDDFLKRFNFL